MKNNKLKEYSKQGDTKKFTDTYNELKTFFESKIDYKKYHPKIYLQGSYGNNTNIEDESDVDIVIEMTTAYYYNINSLSEDNQVKFRSEHPPSSISVKDFKMHIINILDLSHYDYEVKNKCIKIISGTSLNADIIICAKYKKFTTYYKCIEGITFFDKKGNQIVSYPKNHKENMMAKNKLVPDFKPTVRIFKNLKTETINKGVIDENSISSYFIESMIYNVKNYYFTISDLQNRILDIISWCIEYITHYEMITPCEQYYLFGKGENQWNERDALNFLRNAQIIVED